MNDFDPAKLLVRTTEHYAWGFIDWRATWGSDDLKQESAVSRALRGANDSRNGWEGPSEEVRYD